jgi:chromosome partitioning protein
VLPEGQKATTPKLILPNVAATIFSNKGRLDLIPSTLQLMELEISPRGTEYRLKNFVDRIREAYDLIFIDCPPTLSIFTLSAYLASDSVLVPVKPDWLSTIGLPLLEKAMEQYEEDYGHKITLLGIIFTMVDKRTTLMKERMDEIRKTRKTFENYLRHSIKVAKAVGVNMPLFLYPESKPYGEEIINITNELWTLLEKINYESET